MDKPHWVPDGALQIPSGWIMLERERDHVLAFNPLGAMSRYATWRIGQDGILCAGEYYAYARHAVKSYETRAGL